MVWPFVAFVCLFLVNVYNGTIVPLFIVHKLHGNSHDIGLIFSLCAGLEIPLMMWMGSLAKRIPNHTLIMVGALMSLLYFTILLLSTAPWQIVAAQILQATYVAIVMGNGLSYFTHIMPESPGLATTIYSNSTVIGSLIGNLSGGVVAQYFGYRSVFAIGLGVVVLAFLFLWQSREKAYGRA
jgi:MFS family permease